MENFVQERITQLRLRKGISEYKMSYDLGHSRSYINNISSGKALPSLNELFAICSYFEITPSAFFDKEEELPELTQKLFNEIKCLNESDIYLLLNLIKRFSISK